MVLLTPGPCMTSESVRQAAALPDLNHRDPEYLRIVHETREALLRVYPATQDWQPYLIGGSGTAAVEAMIASCISKGPVLVVENGYYSARIKEILQVYNFPFETFRLGWLDSWDAPALERLETMLKQGSFEALLCTHNETTVGRLNPIADIGTLCRSNGTRFVVDAMSSFGADPIDFTCIDAVVSSANKCLHGIPGLSFVLLRPEWAAEVRNVPRRSFYLHLPSLEGESPPTTPPVPAMRALHQALLENRGGHSARRESYEAKRIVIQKSLAEMGLSFAVPEGESSSTLVCPTLPAGWSFDRWFNANRDRGFLVYGCKQDLHEKYFQASVMGEVTLEQVHDWVAVVGDLLG